MNKENLLSRTKQLRDELTEIRRKIHKNAEIGFNLPNTTKIIVDTLTSYGYSPEICGKSGIIATVGKGDKCILLRADMDALPIKEDSVEEFACTNGNSHACGHDLHTTMLLGAAKLLKENEDSLNGVVKLMFQPAEEILSGAEDMLKNGLLENPKVDVAFAMHVSNAENYTNVGHLIIWKDILNRTGDSFKITINGVDAHGSNVHLGVDAISVASYINLALQTVISREIPSSENSIILPGTVHAGTSSNTVAGNAVMEVSVRTQDNEKAAFLKKRIIEVSEGIASAFRASATVEHVFGVPALFNNPSLTDDFSKFASDLLGEEMIHTNIPRRTGGGEDFSLIAHNVPSSLFYIGAGTKQDGYTAGAHRPDTKFDENVLDYGSAIYSYIAFKWLENNC